MPALNEQRLRALERRIQLDLARDRHAELIDELLALTARHPLRERLWIQLMSALDGSGRRTEALAAYQTARQHLAEELGVEPGEEMSRLHLTILTGRQPAASAEPVGLLPVPRQLPPDVRGFAGRAGPLARLDALFASGDQGTGAVVISAIAGTAGVGKTALAVRWARRMADAFPDGQLWVNLRGYHPAQAVTPERALTGFLRALGVPGERIPLDVEEQAALYRSQLDGRRMLIVLDNARDPDQVRPLLPGAPGSFVVVTSRSQLTGLIATENAGSLVLDLLPVGEARQLLANRLGAHRVGAEPAATDEIIDRCARLPLALAVAAARAATQPTLPLEALAAQLRTSRLDTLASAGPATDARAVFSWSYRALTPAAQQLFRLLGSAPGPDISVSAVASLAAIPVAATRSQLAELVAAHLLTEPTAGRYASHDLLRSYANELAGRQDGEPERRVALRRLLDHYLHSGFAGAHQLNPQRQPITLDRPQPGVVFEEPADYDEALAWFDAEHAGLLALVEQAAATGFDTHVCQFAWATTDFLYRRGHWQDWLAIQRAALAAARRLADRPTQALAHRMIGMAYGQMGNHADGDPHLRSSLELYEALDDPLGQAQAHINLGALLSRQERYPEALWHGTRALELYTAVGHRMGQAGALNAIGWYHTQLGDHRAALSYCERALALQRELNDRNGEASTWDSLGFAHHQLGDRDQAISCYQRAIDLYAELGVRFYEATALTHLGDAHDAAGDTAEARTAWQRALTILDELDHPEADRVRAKLHAGP